MKLTAIDIHSPTYSDCARFGGLFQGVPEGPGADSHSRTGPPAKWSLHITKDSEVKYGSSPRQGFCHI